MADAGFKVGFDERRGLDHGAWVPMMHLLPHANVPVFQVSMPVALNAAQAVKLGRALAPLRKQGVMIVGSGGMTHNLHEFRQSGTKPQAYAREFSAWVRTAVVANAVNSFVNYRALAPTPSAPIPPRNTFCPCWWRWVRRQTTMHCSWSMAALPTACCPWNRMRGECRSSAQVRVVNSQPRGSKRTRNTP